MHLPTSEFVVLTSFPKQPPVEMRYIRSLEIILDFISRSSPRKDVEAQVRTKKSQQKFDFLAVRILNKY
jgi:hypothetical protein